MIHVSSINVRSNNSSRVKNARGNCLNIAKPNNPFASPHIKKKIEKEIRFITPLELLGILVVRKGGQLAENGESAATMGTPLRVVPDGRGGGAYSGSWAMLPAAEPQYSSPFGHCVWFGRGQSLGGGSGHVPTRMRASRFIVRSDNGLIGHGAIKAADGALAERAPHVLQ